MRVVKRVSKFWLLFALGVCLFTPFFLLVLILTLAKGTALLAALYGAPLLIGFILYCHFIYRSVYKRIRPKYPIIPPEGRTDIYFPRTDIPRPIYEDVRRYPKFFRKEKQRGKAERQERMKRKK
jgi:hypothetical protein